MKLPAQLRQRELVAWFLIHDISKAFFNLVDKEMRALGLTRAQWFLMTNAYYFEGFTQQELADMMDLTKSSAAKLIRKVEKKGWISRKSDQNDGRIYRVYVTPSMRPAIQGMAKLAKLALDGPISELSEEDLSHLLRVMKIIEAKLESGSGTSNEKIDAVREDVTQKLVDAGLSKPVRKKKRVQPAIKAR